MTAAVRAGSHAPKAPRRLVQAGSAVVVDAERDLLAGLEPDRRRRLTTDLVELFRNSPGRVPGSR